METDFVMGAPLIECTLNEILFKHKNACNSDLYKVNYSSRKIESRDFQGQWTTYNIDDLIADVRKEARSKGYNLQVIGGMYA